MKTYEFHEYCSLFPRMSDSEFKALCDDMRDNGFRTECPIYLYEGKILDGRNRYLAAKAVKVEPVFEKYSGDNPLAFVVSQNIHRRHLNEEQRSLIAARLANMPQGKRTDLEPSANLPKVMVSQSEAAELLKVSTRSVTSAKKVLKDGIEKVIELVERGVLAISAAEKISELDKKDQRKAAALLENGASAPAVIQQINRTQKIADIVSNNQPISGKMGKFNVLYADPPWQYEHVKTESRAIENQYPTMTLDDICALPVCDISHDDSVLFLWATSPKLEEAMRVVNEWGFTYRTCMVWVKDKIGMGYYARQRHELLLIATKGNLPTPTPENRPDSVIESPRVEHSEKPKVFYEIIESMYPELPRIELFSRSAKDGWVVWGNQAP